MRSASFIAVATALALFVLGAFGLYAYDQGREDTIADGVRVSGIDVGGLSRAEATRKLRTELVDPLSRDVVVAARGQRHTLTADVAELRVDLDGTVAEAIRRSRDGNALTRTFRGLTGGEVDADLEPDVSYSQQAVKRLVARVERNIERKPRDARVEFTAAGLKRLRSRMGVTLDREDLTDRVERALLQPEPEARTVPAKVRKTKPKVPTTKLAGKYDTVLVVNRSTYQLKLYKKLKLVKQYGIAVGQVGLETPAGLYTIQNKAVNPAWNVPNSAWAGDLAGTVVPGGVPENPLKARWMGIYNGAGIHGTDARGSIGTNASHGCIRMLVEDVIELYDQVPVGAPVYIA